MKESLKLKNLPPYIFAQLDALIHEKLDNGEELHVLSKSGRLSQGDVLSATLTFNQSYQLPFLRC